jgi:GNAT superfamily N-acetyltransferase
VEVRPARAEDLGPVREIAASYWTLDEWPRRPDYLDFELERESLWVALADGAVTGFAGVLLDEPIAHLADAFVRRDALGRGVGAALLDAAFDVDATRVTFASRDERALPLYARAGLRPFAPLLYLAGSMPGQARVERVPVVELAEPDAAASGRPRVAALEFLARAGAYGLVAPGGGYAVVRPTGRGGLLGPAAGDAGDLLAFVAAASAAHGSAELALFGPHPALRPLLDAGFRIESMDTYMSSRPGVHDLERYVPNPDLG